METESGGGRSLTIGVDLGDRASCWCALDGAGEVLARGQVINEKQPLEVLFQQMPPSLVALEVGSHSAWVGRALEAVGASFADPVRGCPSASAFAIACLLPHLSWSRAGWKFYPVADEAKGVGEGPKAGPTRPPPTTQPEPAHRQRIIPIR